MIPQYDTYLVAVSGGKDSTALWLWALENLPPDHVCPVHNPTGASWPESVSHLSYLESKLGSITYVQAGDIPLPPRRDRKPRQPFAHATNLKDMIRLRGKWPSFWQRYCTRYLKEWPLRLYAKTVPNSAILLGERRSESKRRAGLPPSGDLFLGQRAYRHDLYRPILDWSSDDVASILKTHLVDPNPIYQYTDRTGCWCCPLARVGQLSTFCRLHPDIAEDWSQMEREIGHTWRKDRSIQSFLDGFT